MPAGKRQNSPFGQSPWSKHDVGPSSLTHTPSIHSPSTQGVESSHVSGTSDPVGLFSELCVLDGVVVLRPHAVAVKIIQTMAVRGTKRLRLITCLFSRVFQKKTPPQAFEKRN